MIDKTKLRIVLAKHVAHVQCSVDVWHPADGCQALDADDLPWLDMRETTEENERLTRGHRR